jgi:hypothetical protein
LEYFHRYCVPTPTLIQEIAKLHHPKQIQLVWITNAPIPDALSPDNETLAAAILAAINRFSE